MARLLGAAMLVVAASADGPCCKKCVLPLIKYYSVDLAHGFCGDVCADPKKFSIFKKFEANLTLVDDENPDCSGQYTPDGKFYTDYDSTVTHGDPFGILAMTLDLYAPTGMPDHSCCSTPLPLRINCGGKPKSMLIRGTGPYCCPASATEEDPCKKEVVMEEKKEVAMTSTRIFSQTAVSSSATPEFYHFPFPSVSNCCIQFPAAWVNMSDRSTPRKAFGPAGEKARCPACCEDDPDAPGCPSADQQWIKGSCASAGKGYRTGWCSNKDDDHCCTEWCDTGLSMV